MKKYVFLIIALLSGMVAVSQPTISGGTRPTAAFTGGNLTTALNEVRATAVASASTTDIGAVAGNFVHITGTVSITSLGTIQAGTQRTVVFDGILTLTNSVNMILPGNSSILTSVGDIASFISEGSGIWRCTGYVTYSTVYTNYTPTWTGFSTPPTAIGSNARYMMLGRKTCHVIVTPSAVGVSNAAITTITLPFPAANNGTIGQISPTLVYNNGAFVASGYIQTALNSNVATFKQGAFLDFTATGNKSGYLSFVYEIELP